MRGLKPGMLAAAVLGLGACASAPPPPTEQLAVTRAAIEEAQTAGATERAPVEMQAARRKLDESRRAVVEDDNARARRLAEQAEADARLAAAKARSSRSQEAVAALQASIRTMRDELARDAATAPAR